MPLPRAIGRCPHDILEGCGSRNESSPEGLASFVTECGILDDSVRRNMERFSEDAGKGYRDEQLALCDYCLSLLDARRAQLCSQLPLRIKVNSALSLAGAAAVVILLI